MILLAGAEPERALHQYHLHLHHPDGAQAQIEVLGAHR